MFPHERSAWSCSSVFSSRWGSPFVVKRYVQDRVDLLHRTVHEARRGRSKGTHIAGDDIGDVSNEVSAWAEGKYPEIKELRERERYRREFIGNLAHELRTPIFNIQGYILTLLEGGLEDPKVNRDFLQRATRAWNALSALWKIWD